MRELRTSRVFLVTICLWVALLVALLAGAPSGATVAALRVLAGVSVAYQLWFWRGPLPPPPEFPPFTRSSVVFGLLVVVGGLLVVLILVGEVLLWFE
jgi:hypothetical protein